MLAVIKNGAVMQVYASEVRLDDGESMLPVIDRCAEYDARCQEASPPPSVATLPGAYVLGANVVYRDWQVKESWDSVRAHRSQLLLLSDWTQLADSECAADYAAYRQALRNIPQDFATPGEVVWPVKP